MNRPKRPTFRAFVEGDKIGWFRINPDGTPGEPASSAERADISQYFRVAIRSGEAWVSDFFSALKANGKANLRGDQ